LNEDLASTVCILSIVNISFAVSGIVWLLKLDSVDTETEPISGVSVLNTILWMLIAVAPFIQVRLLQMLAVLVSRQKSTQVPDVQISICIDIIAITTFVMMMMMIKVTMTITI